MRFFRALRDVPDLFVGLLAVAGIWWILFPFPLPLSQAVSPSGPSAEPAGMTPANAAAGPAATPAGGLGTERSKASNLIAKRPPPAEIPASMRAVAQALQQTPAGQVQLGKQFFERSRLAMNDFDKLRSDTEQTLRIRVGTNRPLPVDRAAGLRSPEPEWIQLVDWWNSKGSMLKLNYAGKWQAAFNRFQVLSTEPARRTERELDELRGLVLTCGRDWLRIPYDAQTNTFRTHDPLPLDSPEAGVQLYRRIIKALTGQEWSAGFDPRQLSNATRARRPWLPPEGRSEGRSTYDNWTK